MAKLTMPLQYQEAAPTMEDAIRLYLVNGPDIVNKLIAELNSILATDSEEDELMEFIVRHSDYVENDSAIDTLNLIRRIMLEG